MLAFTNQNKPTRFSESDASLPMLSASYLILPINLFSTWKTKGKKNLPVVFYE
jgi:hypothetical protein